MSEENKALIRRAVEDVWNGNDPDAIEELVARDFVIHTSSTSNDIHGREGARQYFAGIYEAFPDIRFEIADQIAEGDRVVTRWIARGTHQGAFQGIPPTGKPIRIEGLDIDCVAGGKVVECWTNVDELGLLRQIDAMPQPETVG
ncbi:ester cyclase [soil metagenome]